MLSVARWRDVHVEFGARCTVSLHWLAGIVCGELLERVVDILRNQAAFLDPTFLPTVGAHPQKAALLLQHFHAVAVVHGSDLVVHGGDAVAQAGFWCGDVHVFVFDERSALASATQGKQNQRKREQRNPKASRNGKISPAAQNTIAQSTKAWDQRLVAKQVRRSASTREHRSRKTRK